MGRGINKVILVGTLGQEPEVRYTQSGAMIVSLSVATSEKWKDKQTGEPKEATEWHRIEIWGDNGKYASEYLHKGSQVYIEGSLKTSKWQDQQGQDRYTTSIKCREWQNLTPKNAQQPANSAPQSQPVQQFAQSTQNVPVRQTAQSPSNNRYNPNGTLKSVVEQAPVHSGYEHTDDDIPWDG